MKANQTRQGFTLMEILVCFTILSVLLTAVLQSYSDMTNIVYKTGKMESAAKFARLKLAESERNALKLRTPIIKGVFEAGHELAGASWEQKITQERYFRVMMRKITVQIQWKESEKTRKYEDFILVGSLENEKSP